MAKHQRSAKDKAFDEERSKLNKRIRELESQVKTKELEIRTLKEENEKEKEKLEQLQDWNRRLLEYMDLDESDMRMIIGKEKAEGEILSAFSKMTEFLGPYRTFL